MLWWGLWGRNKSNNGMSKTAVQKDQFPSQFEGLGRRFGMGACRLDPPQIQV